MDSVSSGFLSWFSLSLLLSYLSVYLDFQFLVILASISYVATAPGTGCELSLLDDE